MEKALFWFSIVVVSIVLVLTTMAIRRHHRPSVIIGSPVYVSVCGQSTPLVVASMKISFEVHEICWHGVSTVAGSMEQKSKVNSILSVAIGSLNSGQLYLRMYEM